ncbi:MAG: glycosyltransferase family 2 protein [Rhodospirillales bacterium]|nr:glycosyltransferase family 2 protein [Acetobacter sp.]
MNVPSALAIIVPAYRARYLRAALDSLARQTSQDFRVYVFDDASPDNLQAVHDASLLGGQANAEFRRFDQNLGGTSLAAHWNRCVQATRGESWLWLFSDDDVAGARCVEQFHRAREAGGLPGNVCRFDTTIINHDGAVIEITPPHPTLESAEHFAYHRLRLQRRSFAPEYLFRRAAFDAHGGFVDFPFALGSDDASWITFAEDRPIVALAGARVFWRWSGANTSFLHGKNRRAKVLALASFSEWMARRFGAGSPTLEEAGVPSLIRMDQVARQWFFRTMQDLPAGFGYLTAVQVAWALHRRHFVGFAEGVVRLWLGVLRAQSRALAQWMGKRLRR